MKNIIRVKIIFNNDEINFISNEDIIKEKINEKISSKCFINTGYIMKIYSYKKISGNKISEITGNVEIFYDVFVESFKPIIGLEVEGKIEKIFPLGLIAFVENIVPIFIATEKTFNKDSLIKIRITDVQFRDGSFSSFGEICG